MTAEKRTYQQVGERSRVVTYGGGKQSTVLVHMAIDGLLPNFDAVIFADTQNEMPSTYEHLDYMRRRTEAAGIPFLIVTKGDLWYDVMTEKHPPTLPAHAINEEGKPSRINGYNCSYDYKRRIVQAAEKRLCGPPGAWKRATVEQWVGYTTDEMSRCKDVDECRCGHKRAATAARTDGRPRGHLGACRECSCERFDPWLVNRWPLIELGMRRSDCAKWLTDRGYPVPSRSACYFCPNRGNGHWRALKAGDPERFGKACQLDERTRTEPERSNLRVRSLWIHGSRVPLAEADLRSPAQRAAEDDGQDSLFDEGEVDNDCDLGTCFT